jgi:hypothetical protein
MTRPVANERPNLAALDPREVDGRRRIAAETPTPRDVCPGCLRDLRGYPRQQKRGWCVLCYPRRDAILSELLRVVDPAWKKPDRLVRAERAALEAMKTTERLRESAECAARRAAELAADARYLRQELRVCLDCGEAPAEGRDGVCRRCLDWRQAGAPKEEPCADR